MYGTVAEVMRFQVLFRQWTRVRHALKGGRHDARGKRVAPDLNLSYLPNTAANKQIYPLMTFLTHTHTAFDPGLSCIANFDNFDRNPIGRLDRW